jgi:hypothetical protein
MVKKKQKNEDQIEKKIYYILGLKGETEYK